MLSVLKWFWSKYVAEKLCFISAKHLNRRLWCQKQVSRAWISNYIPQYSAGCRYLSMPLIPASGTKVLNWWKYMYKLYLDMYNASTVEPLYNTIYYARYHIQRDIQTNAPYCSDFVLTKDTPYLALTGELWSVSCEYFSKKQPCYEGFLL